MCGRYFIDRNIIDKLLEDMYDARIKPGDIHPGDFGIIASTKGYEVMQWGKPIAQKLVFNARSESVCTKPFFQDDFINRRCIIFARSFYEWNKEKKQYRFHYPKNGIMLMGGLYDSTGHYVIITKPANASIIAIHDRMPFLLAPGVMKDYLFDEEKAKALLIQKQPPLVNEAMDGQLSLFEV